MPPNQSPFASLFNLFKGSSQQASPPGANSFGAFPRYDGPPSRIGGYPGPGGGYGGYSGFGGYPGGGNAPGYPGFKAPGSGPPGMGGSVGSGSFGIGDIFKNLGKVDIGKVMNGINSFRNLMSNAQKVATTLNQLGITVSNVQKFMKQVDVNALMNLLGSNGEASEDTSEENSTLPAPTPVTPQKKKYKKKKKQPTYSRVRKKNAPSPNRRVHRLNKPRKTRDSKPLFKMPT